MAAQDPKNRDPGAALSARSRVTGRAPLDHVHVVLVEPQGPRNVGAVARAMCNFGLRHLHLVGGVPASHPEAVEMAVHSRHLLEGARQMPDLGAALAGMTYVVGTTGKPRHRLAILTPPDAANAIVREASRGEVALVLGREDHGLDAEELAHAHAVVSIPASPDCRALNLSQAMVILAYELFVAAGSPGAVRHGAPGNLLTNELRERLKDELIAAMAKIGIVNEGNVIPCTRSMARILALGPMQTRDARLLFTLARRLQSLDGPSDAAPIDPGSE